MRTFIAIDLPEDVKIYLRNLQDEFLKEKEAGKLFLAKDYHLTLKFLGEIDEVQHAKVNSLLNNVRGKSFTFTLNKFGLFPSRRFPRVLWIGIQPEDDVILLQKIIEETLKAEFNQENDFKPHITLARVKFLTDKQLPDKLASFPVKPLQIQATAFKLFKSTLTGAGAEYETLATFPLQTTP